MTSNYFSFLFVSFIELLQIVNPDWDKFIDTVLISRIKEEMSLKATFKASLHKLLLYTSGSFFKSHRDSEKENNMFGTLVVQLPSKYKGGQLIVRHDGKTKTFDFSSSDLVNNSLSTFFSSFYCDCEHEILPVTEGFRLCLVYNLITIDAEVPLAPQMHALDMKLISLLRNWEESTKLVYALTHKYSQENLSFDNLKTTDKIVANVLKRVSNVCDLNIYLALFEKNCSGVGEGYGGYGYGGYGGYHSNGCESASDGEFEEISYTLTSLISDFNNEKIDCSELTVDFTEEVIPIDCFSSMKPYHHECEHTGNEGIQMSKSYRCAAITFWPKKFTFQVLRNSNAPHNLTDVLFLKEAKKYFDDNCSSETKVKILEWAEFIVFEERYMKSKYTIEIVDTIIKLKHPELIPKLIHNGMASGPEAFTLVINECDKYGWAHFATATTEMFKKLQKNDAIRNLLLFFGDGRLNQEKNKMFCDLLQIIFDKRETTRVFLFSSAEETKQQQEETKLLERLLNAVLQYNDQNLLLKFVDCILPLRTDTISSLATICGKFGWEPFSTIILDKFKTLSKKDEVVYLVALIQNGILTGDKKALCLNLFRVMLDKNQELVSNSSYRQYPPNSAVVTKKEDIELMETLMNAAVIFNDVQLMKNIVLKIVPLNSETISIIIDQSKIYGWNAFAPEIKSKFEKLSQIDGIKILSLLIEKGNLKAERTLCINLFQIILGKTHPLPSNNYRAITQEEKSRYLKEKQDILYTICRLAENLNFNLLAFAKKQSFKDFVPVLIQFVQKDTNRLRAFWAITAIHFIAEMGKESIKDIEVSWIREGALNACCSDCISLNNFLRSNKQQESYRIGEKRRKHLQQRINLMENMEHRTDVGGRGQIGVLIVTKTKMSGIDALQDRTLSRRLLDQLRSVMPNNSVLSHSQ